MRKLLLCFALTLAASSGLVHAHEIPWFSLYPEYSISGAAGSTVGWGFYIENYDPELWISITSLTPQNQTNPSLMTSFVDWLTPLGGNTDYAIAPGDYWWITDFDLNLQVGVGSYTIAAGASPGASDSGILRLGYDVYTGNPTTDGVYVGSYLLDVDYSPSYTVTVTGDVPEPSDVPEPATAGMLLGAAVALIPLRKYIMKR